MRRYRSLVLETLDGKVLLSAIATPPVPVSPPIIAPVSQGLVMKLSTDHQVYRRGQPVVITLTETNTSQHDITVDSGPSLGGFFVTHNGRKIWASNAGIQPMFVLVRTLSTGAVDHAVGNLERSLEHRVCPDGNRAFRYRQSDRGRPASQYPDPASMIDLPK